MIGEFRRVTIAQEDPGTPDIRAMLAEADAHFRARYPAENNYLIDVASLRRPEIVFLAAREDGRLVGIGALRTFGAWGEIKRMYVPDAERGHGIGRAILTLLKERARGMGLGELRLETGTKQFESHAMYRKAGFADRGPFGDYTPSPHNRFMEMRL